MYGLKPVPFNKASSHLDSKTLRAKRRAFVRFKKKGLPEGRPFS